MADIGGADSKLLLAAGQTGDGAASDMDPVPWDKDWHSRFEDWKSAGATPAPIMLVFCKHPGVNGDQLNCKQIFQFGLVSQRPECGVYLVGRSSTGNGWKLPNTGIDHQKNCEFVSSAELGGMPAVLIGMNPSDIAFFPHGINNEGQGILIPSPLVGSPFDDELLSKELQHFAESNLVASELRGELWIKADEYWPTELAEKTIQKFLLISLRAVFKNYEILPEISVIAGRIDILILPGLSSDPGRSVLELKAVRQFGSTGKKYSRKNMVRHLKSGIEQAETYFKNATHKYLCAYDMRKDKESTIFVEVDLECGKVGVKLKKYVVQNSATKIRQAIAQSSAGHQN